MYTDIALETNENKRFEVIDIWSKEIVWSTGLPNNAFYKSKISSIFLFLAVRASFCVTWKVFLHGRL